MNKLNVTSEKLVLIWGLIASIFIFSITLKYEIEKERSSFAILARSIITKIESALDSINKINREFSALFYLADEVDDGAFDFLTSTLIRQNNFIETIYFAEKISTKNKKQYELSVEEQGYTGFKIKPFSATEVIPKSLSGFIFPIKYISPYSVKTSRWFGMNLLTFPVVNKGFSLRSLSSSLFYAMTSTEKNKLFASRILFNTSSDTDSGDIENAFGILLYKIDAKNLFPAGILSQDDSVSMYLDGYGFYATSSLKNKDYFSMEFDFESKIELAGQEISIKIIRNKCLFQFNLLMPILMFAAGLFLTFFAWYVIRSHIEHNKFLAEQNRIIENEVFRKTEELSKKADELALAYNRQVALVEELESFSYSVSHDLRSPLRALDGFSRALEEDYAKDLDDSAKDFIARICKASERMGTLIDALLSLSRISRKGLLVESFSISAMAEEIVKTLREENPDRNIEVIIDSSLCTKADKSLIYVVLDNLLRNAWKYTLRETNSVIEVGKEIRRGEMVFFVKDNGVGFEMAYAGRLFGSFQRLHREDEFEGNGIGLATAKRIIVRHNGEIWAEAIIGKGATFFFTLPELKEDFKS